jgi:hypothetical protein
MCWLFRSHCLITSAVIPSSLFLMKLVKHKLLSHVILGKEFSKQHISLLWSQETGGYFTCGGTQANFMLYALCLVHFSKIFLNLRYSAVVWCIVLPDHSLPSFHNSQLHAGNRRVRLVCWSDLWAGNWGPVRICGPGCERDLCRMKCYNESMEPRPGFAWFIHQNLAWNSGALKCSVLNKMLW